MRSPCRQPGVSPAVRQGIAAAHRVGHGAAKARGFTLVELMVVLVIVGLMGTAVVLTAPSQSDVLTRESEDLGMRLVRAQEEAILGTRAIEVTVNARGYSFSRQRFGEWQALEDGPFGHVAWKDGTQPVFGSTRTQLTFQFDPTGGARIETLTLARDGQRMRVAVDAASKVKVDALPR